MLDIVGQKFTLVWDHGSDVAYMHSSGVKQGVRMLARNKASI